MHEYEASPESVKGDGAAADLVRVIRKIAQVRKRLAQIENEVQELNSSEILQLKAKADKAAKQGRDLLQEIADDLDLQIAESHQTLEELSKEQGQK